VRYRLDADVEVLDGGRVLLGGGPTRLLRLSDAGARLVERWRRDGFDDTGVAGTRAVLMTRLVDAGMAHPAPDPAPVLVDDLVVVVPVRDRVGALDRCLAALVASGVASVVVVDDASADGPGHAAVAARHGAAVVRRTVRGGPAAARMTGWRSLDPRPSFVAFVDSDVAVTPECWGALLGHFGTPACGLVAPRVRHTAGHGSGAGVVDRYEAASSPLDLGADPAPVRAGGRVSYVPAAAMVVRSDAFAEAGGFDEGLEVGEDVDLVWRLADAGWRCRYDPSVVVEHAGRSHLGALLRRRVDYGRSAAVLDARHPGALPPVRGSRWSVAVTALGVTGHPVLAFALAVGNAEALGRRLGDRRLASRLVMRGHVGFARQTARALVRPWFPVLLVSRRARWATLAAAAWSWVERRPDVALPTWVVLRLADDLAYSAGVWAGCVRQRRWAPLRPDISHRPTGSVVQRAGSGRQAAPQNR